MTEGKGSMTKHVFILRREVYSGFYVVKFPHVSNILVMDQSNGSFRGKKIVGAPFH